MSIATFPFRCAGSTPALISLDPITVINAPSPTDALRALAEMAIAASPPRLSTHPGRFLAVLRPPSRSSLTSNPHSAAAQPGPTSRDFVPWRFLDARQLSVPSASFLPASKNLHIVGHVFYAILLPAAGTRRRSGIALHCVPAGTRGDRYQSVKAAPDGRPLFYLIHAGSKVCCTQFVAGGGCDRPAICRCCSASGPPEAHLLVHCRAGVSRSIAAAALI